MYRSERDGKLTTTGNIDAVLPYAPVSSAMKRPHSRCKIFETLLKYIKLYCESSTLAGFKYLTEPSRMWIERVIWITVHVITLCVLSYFVFDSYMVFTRMPIITVVDTDHFPISKISFPGVAICSINRISKQAATKMATEIFSSNVSDLSLDEILALIMQLGDLYSSMFSFGITRHEELHRLLLDYYKGEYNVTNIMKELTPECSDMLLVCSFNSEKQNCSDVFSVQKTEHGFCCLFNSIDQIVETARKQPVRVKEVGIERGLSIVMQPMLADYFYSFLPLCGWKVMIFNPPDYPDTLSGGISNVIVLPLTESYVELDAVTFYSTDHIAHYNIKKRECIFSREVKTRYGHYSFSDCLVNCREDIIWKFCGCIPFEFPTGSRRVCNSLDMICINRHRQKWVTVLPYGDKFQDSMTNSSKIFGYRCSNCYPSCDDIKYITRHSRSNMNPGTYQTSLIDDMEIVDEGILHVYFAKHGVVKLKQDVAYTWYKLLSDIGGICGVFVGFSLISVVELAYFAVLLIFALARNLLRGNDTIEVENPRKESTVGTIYWNELAPRKRDFKMDDLLLDRFKRY